MKHNVVIGKYTLESLTNGMYSSALDLYREYIQNAVDSIDEAVSAGLISKKESEIKISINSVTKTVSIVDNGCGISVASAAQTLMDIGNSKKSRKINRGFRGIGRLAGLGYCDKLTFITSYYGEAQKTTVTFNAKLLKKLLSSNEESNGSIYEVLNEVIEVSVSSEKSKRHYFEVLLENVADKNDLCNYIKVHDYAIQNFPLPFSPCFKWGQEIIAKLKMLQYEIPCYKILLSFDEKEEELFKPYTDSIVSDRIKKLEDSILNIVVCPISGTDGLLGILWYASTNYLGTIIDNLIKGIRIRQGNILIGDKTTCSQFFKEDRFNGWVVGEIYTIDPELIANSRRDNFEQNHSYFTLCEGVKEYTSDITKEIRKLSYSRSLSNEKKKIVNASAEEDVNGLFSEDMSFTSESDEFTLMNEGDSQLEAESDFIDKLSILLGQKQQQTKYHALNINDKLTIEQRKTLERVFDLITDEYGKKTSEKFVDTIARKF